MEASRLDKDYFLRHTSIARVNSINAKEVVGRFALAPGNYCIVPFTFNPGEEAAFLLRIFTEKKMDTRRMDDITAYTPKPKANAATHASMDAKLYPMFRKIAGNDDEIDPFEMQTLMNAAMKKSGKEFSLDTARSLVAANDTELKGKLNYEEFRETWKDISEYKRVFAEKDKDRSGDMDAVELKDAFRKLGFAISSGSLRALNQRFANKKGLVSFDDFISCAIRMKVMFETYMDWQKPGARFSLDDYITSTIGL